MPTSDCPNCGDVIDPRMAAFRHVVCASCGTSLLIEDDAVRQAGQAGVMHAAQMLFGLGDRITVWGTSYDILGHARFSYGRGFWDEFQARDADGASAWISVDEGDIAIQTPLDRSDWPSTTTPPRSNTSVMAGGTSYRVSEFDQAECVALRGGFDEDLIVGETYDFVNCTSDTGALLSGEFWTGGRAWFVGDWADPFDIQVDPAP